MRLLLDTCTLIWLLNEPEKLSSRVRTLALDPANELLLSPISLWELALKLKTGRLTFRTDFDRVPEEARAKLGAGLIPFSEEAALLSIGLGSHHRDPFDRMLICQAMHERAPILTPDPLIAKYPVEVIW